MDWTSHQTRLSNRRVQWSALVILVLAFSVATSGQTSSGRLIGKVTDPQGAALAGANVTAINAGTNIQRDTQTDAEGSFQFLDVPVGRYILEVNVKGFAKVTTQPQELNINQSVRVDFSLRISTVTQQVTIVDEATLVETVNPTVGGSVTGAPVRDLPLNGRNALDLALTQPGVVPAIGSTYTAGSFTVAGGRPDAVTFLLDGGVNNAVIDNNVNFNPNPDTVAEFRILQNNYTAEYGRNGGGIVSVVTKSGTNEFHGTLFEYVRNDAFNANTYFGNANELPRPILKRHQFGGTFGGPVLKNRAFFFFGYQGQRQSQTLSGQSVATYTPAELSGDFSHSGAHGFDPNKNDPGVACFLSGLNENAVDRTTRNFPAHPGRATSGWCRRT